MKNKKIISTNEVLYRLKEKLDTENVYINALENTYLFNKLTSLCTKKGKKKMALKYVISSFKKIKYFFRINAIFFLKMAVIQMEPFIFLHKIPIGNKEIIYPRILPMQTRAHNALYIIVKQAFQTCSNFSSFSDSLAHSILDNCNNNNYKKKVVESIEIAELNKRNIKHTKKEKGKQTLSKIRRYERFKLFKKIKAWK